MYYASLSYFTSENVDNKSKSNANAQDKKIINTCINYNGYAERNKKP